MGTQSLSDKLVRYVDFIHATSRRAKLPGYSRADWDPLREMVSDDFIRVGRYGEVQNWDECVDLMHQWAAVGEIESTGVRMTEVGRKVFYEIREESNFAGNISIFQTLSVVTFNDDGLICRYEFYQ